MRKSFLQYAILLFVICLVLPVNVAAQSADEAVVHAVLFYSPTCPHCHTVINNVLVPMVDEYGGDRLQILGVNVTETGGRALYQRAIKRYEIPPNRLGVPMLVIDDVVLVGSVEIPEQFPTLVEEGFAAGGLDWPDIPGLEESLSAETRPEPTPTPTLQVTATLTPTVVPLTSASEQGPTVEASPTSIPEQAPVETSDTGNTPTPTNVSEQAVANAGDTDPPTDPEQPVVTIGKDSLPTAEAEVPPPDPAGMTLASVVLVGMAAAFSFTVWRVAGAQRLRQLDYRPINYGRVWAIPLLSLIGLGIAIYLAYVEVTQVEAVCGPIGQCNLVQSSSYARIMGIPIAVLGVLFYLTVIALWVVQPYVSRQWANLLALGLIGLTLMGTIFSIYLTLLEIFVIHAICAWCISSAVISTLLMLFVVLPVTKHFTPQHTPA